MTNETIIKNNFSAHNTFVRKSVIFKKNPAFVVIYGAADVLTVMYAEDFVKEEAEDFRRTS